MQLTVRKSAVAYFSTKSEKDAPWNFTQRDEKLSRKIAEDEIEKLNSDFKKKEEGGRRNNCKPYADDVSIVSSVNLNFSEIGAISPQIALILQTYKSPKLSLMVRSP